MACCGRNAKSPASRTSRSWCHDVQILQYTLVGFSEVLASIGQIEFFYDQVWIHARLPTFTTVLWGVL